MPQSTAFHIYDASAGSGKTFNLVRIYLGQLLKSRDPGHFRKLLAITFTNKAVGEMKQRILDGLIECCDEKILKDPGSLCKYLIADSGLTAEEVKARSENILQSLLKHYGAFSVETIDGFNHRLIRTFARDLRIPSLFEVELETKQIIAEAVDRLVAQAGDDEQITSVLMDFALQKTEEDKSWDISRDLRKTGELLSAENHFSFLTPYLQADLNRLIAFGEELRAEYDLIRRQIISISTPLMQDFHEGDLNESHFTRGSLYNFYKKLTLGDFSVGLDMAWQRNLGTKNPYPTRIKGETAAYIDSLIPKIEETLEQIRPKVIIAWRLENVLRHFTPLSVIKLIDNEVQQMKKEQGILPIYEFNRIIGEAIKEEPAPFLYERLGNRYQHFMIDEFQDTSVLQWQNLIPLIDNSLAQDDGSGEFGSLLLVGDAKQSIYRWRGGYPEQFISLCKEDSRPFAQERDLIPLKTNYRSLQQIVEFNNSFFTYAATSFEQQDYAELYKRGNEQAANSGKGGFISITLIDGKPKAEEKQPVYCEEVEKRVQTCLSQGFVEGEICVLTRIKREGVLVSAHLLEKGYNVVSSDSLLIDESPRVKLLIELLRSVLQPDNKELRFNWLSLLYDQINTSLQLNDFLKRGVKSRKTAQQLLSDHGFSLDLHELIHLPLYAFFERCINALSLNKSADGFLIGLMDVIHEFSAKPLPTKLNFLVYWDEKKDALSVSGSSGNAIRVMTIHKAKGLEFPVVIFPWANKDIFDERNPLAWMPSEFDPPFDQLLITPKKEISQYSDSATTLLKEHRDRLQLDQMNLLYVTFTRAIEQLHVISEQVKEVGKDIKSYQSLICNYLNEKGLWSEATNYYVFGSPELGRVARIKKTSEHTLDYSGHTLNFDRLFTLSSEAVLWKQQGEESVKLGNELHQLLSKVYAFSDVDTALAILDNPEEPMAISASKAKSWLMQLVSHPMLKDYYDGTDKVLNEQEIIIPGEGSLRPDRLNIHPDGTATVIDYKTGGPREYYKEQVSGYADALKEMGMTVRCGIIIYFSKQGISVNKV